MTKKLQDNTELPRFTARSVSSMSMPPNASYESMDSSAVLTSTLHSQMSKEFKAVEVLRHGEYHINTHTLVPERSGQNDLSGNNHLMNNQHLLMSGPLRLCNNPDCTHCPAAYKAENSHRVGSSSYDSKFRLTYVAPESTVFGAGDLVASPRKIAINYLRGYFLFDLFVVLPLPQITWDHQQLTMQKNLLRITVLLQYVPRIIRFVPLLGGQSTSGFIFESAWANFVINLLMFILAGHVVGSCWYLFGLQDKSSGRMIGHARERNGLYYLETPSQLNMIKGKLSSSFNSELILSNKDKVLLHHCRLGHPSFRVFKVLFPSLCKDLDVESFHCDVCELAKHKRVYFPPFYLIHTDIWGPSPISSVFGA